ncbi:MAG TPA: ABC transporter permease [Bryobacteraceae bacterium]|nr:ABC transporter permease [Bryobacteraceae bacterium]
MSLLLKLKSLLPRRRSALEQDMRDELESLAALAEAEGKRSDVGSLTRVAEESRTVWTWTWVEQLAANVRYAFRAMKRNPGVMFAAVSSLALGIGANTAIFTLLDRVILRSLPVKDPGELVFFKDGGPRAGSVLASYDSDYSFSDPMYRDFRDHGPGLAGVIAWFATSASLSANGHTVYVQTNLVSGNFFDVLGVKTILGRPISPADDGSPGASPVAVLGYSFWVRQLGADHSVLNQRLIVNGQPMTVIGVAQPGFNGFSVGDAPALYVPVSMESQMLPGRSTLENRRSSWLNIVGRLKPGSTPAAAEPALNAFLHPILEAELKELAASSAQTRQRFLNRHISLVPASSGLSALRDLFEVPLFILMGLVAFVLLIACANVANLMLARAAGRTREISIRLALGAGRGDIVRQVLVESAMLSAGGAVLGIALAAWAGTPLLSMLPFSGVTEAISTTPDLRILAFTTIVSAVCAILFGSIPALQWSRSDVASALKQQTASLAGGDVRARKALVVVQVALSWLLLIGAGLFMRSMQNFKAINPGFRTDHLLSFAINPALNGYDGRRSAALYTQLNERMASLPGVSAATLANIALLSGSNWMASVEVPGREAKDNDVTPDVDPVGPGYFSIIGTPLLAGREFNAGDGARAPQVAVVNEAFARMYFDNHNPIGKIFTFRGAKSTPVEIVGLVRDSRYDSLMDRGRPFIFCPYWQRGPSEGMTFYIRTHESPENLVSSIRETVHEADPDLPIFAVKTMDQQIDESIFTQRIISQLSGFFGMLAAALAAIGLYGVMSYLVNRRTREIGIRMALGAGRALMLRGMLSEAAVLIALGVAIALPASFALTRLARSLLYGVDAHDPWVIAAATLLLGSVALLAAYLPAARAARVDPIKALRQD